MIALPRRAGEPLLMTLLRVMDAMVASAVFGVLNARFGIPSAVLWESCVIIFFVTMVCFEAVGFYRSWRVASVFNELHQLCLGCILLYSMLSLISYFLTVTEIYPRHVIMIWAMSFPLLLGAGRVAIRKALRLYRKNGWNLRQVVIAGQGEMADRVADWINANPWSGMRILGVFDDRSSTETEPSPLLGPLSDLPNYVREHRVETVFLALPMRAEAKIQWMLAQLADSTCSVFLIPDKYLLDVSLACKVEYLDSLPILSLRDTPLRGLNAFLKRLEDLIVASIGLVLTAPLMLVIAAGVKLSSPGPLIFKQWRHGLNGKPIQVYKFRTMITCEDGYRFKQAVACDPRVTPFGAILRKTSLDELPQLVNVLQGRMSIVGPRPHAVAMNEQYRKLIPGYMLRHKVRPGITGLAQVNGWRGETDTPEKIENRVRCDLEYLNTWSLWLDVKIFLLTIWRFPWLIRNMSEKVFFTRPRSSR